MRELAMRPCSLNIFSMNEPTSSLDPDRAREIWRLMLTLARDGQTQVIVTHQEELTRGMPCRVVRMESGHIVAMEIQVYE